MRFCTSRSLNTSTTSARLSESPTNSICVIDACCVRGSVTTPARRVTFDSNCDAAATSALESSREASSWRRSSAKAGSSSMGARAFSSESTKKRYPLSVGTRPAEVCGELTKPSCSRSATMLRMVAEDSARPDSRDKDARADRLPVADVAANEHPQQQLFALGKCIVRGFVHWGEATFVGINASRKPRVCAIRQFSM